MSIDITIRDEDTPERIGEKLAARFMWDGNQITECFLAALTEANFHQLRRDVEQLIKQHGE